MTQYSRKKVVLFNPHAVFYDMPLALLAIGSALDSEEFEVKIIDARVTPDYESRVLNELKDAVCFGVTVLTGSPIKSAIDLSKKVKGHYPDMPVIWGGWHPSLFPKQPLLDIPEIDVTVQGQGEETFVELVQALDQRKELHSIQGICFRSGDTIIQTPSRKMVDMNTFQRINYDLIDVEAYFHKKGKRQFDFITSIGCFFRCAFCADPFVYQRRFSSYTPERMADDIEYFYHKYKFTDLNFQDETFFTYPKNIAAFAQEIIKREINISWASTMRADQGVRMTEEQWMVAKKSGLRRLLIGVESGSQEMMDWLKKDIKTESVISCAEKCKKYGIQAIFPFIVGFPNESEESTETTIQFIQKLKSIDPHFQIQIFYFKPYPGSEITSVEVTKGYKLPESTLAWADFDYVGSKGPWVSIEKFRFFENYKFYNKLAYTQKSGLLYPLSRIARWRCSKKNFRFPVEKKMANLLLPAKQLS